MVTHPCIDRQLNDRTCAECAIHDRGFCEAFRRALAKIANHLDARYTSISPADRSDIFSATVEHAVKDLDRFEGRSGAKLSTWIWRIYRNKRADYFRRTPPPDWRERLAMETDTAHDAAADAELEIAIRQCFEALIKTDDTGCVRLYNALYRSEKAGKTRAELARDLGLKLNTLNQRIRRCRKTVARLFRNCLDP